MRITGVKLTRKEVLAIDVAHLYYDAGLTQAEVAERVHVSRPTVSKLLAYAQRKGFVRIEICDPREQDEALIEYLRERFDLTEIRLVGTLRHLPGRMGSELGAQGADMLSSILRDGDTIAVQTSSVLTNLAQHLDPAPRRSIKVWHMARTLSDYLRGREDMTALHLIANQLHAELTTLPNPLLVDSVPEANRLRAATKTRDSLARLASASIAVFSAAPIDAIASTVSELGLNRREAETIKQHAAGELCARIIDAEGRVCVPDLNNRTISVTLPDLRHIEQKILIAGGEQSAPVVRAALVNRYVDRLIVDVDTARMIASLDSRCESETPNAR
ncbi:sugar-binding transcriptional regulator [Actinomyces ruminis]|uniref:sugar-binding transcriptional regulator n=1 Tax=Actinomyces ruminis TaxID=1937003 RepID=UPI000B702AFA|nr:sugar-binding domain-containing protein [Actinomyces ruminis]